MSQSRKASFTEALVNVGVGFIVSVAITAVVFPLYGHEVSLSHNIQITLIFTVASVARGYVLRRFFNHYTFGGR